jgi:poly-gamma-glutamate synthesis protein (capsule biosynthesis protein)
MGHGMQIKGAYDEKSGTYCYNDVFSRMSSVFKLADFTIANLEVTIAGAPFTGYPQFSSPDELIDGLTNAGVNVLVTANNHTVDRGKQGILRTINVLKSKGVPFAGAYRDSAHRDTAYPLILEQNGIRIALLNYTYGTNGIPIPYPTIVNLIDTALIRADFNRAKSLEVDEVVAFMHWGVEYERNPSIEQLMLTRFMHDLGIRLVIGSHPHVIQRMEASYDSDSTHGRAVVFSLGNFVSNQRPRYRNGGSIAVIHIEKELGVTKIANAGYLLAYVHTPLIDGKTRFQVLPVAKYEQKTDFFLEQDQLLFNEFANDSRRLLNSQNYNFPEIGYRNEQWIIPWRTKETLLPPKIKRIEPWNIGFSYPQKLNP